MIGLSPLRRLRPLLVLGLILASVPAAAQIPDAPLTADQAVRIALERNYDVAMAVADHDAARGRSLQAYRGILPSFTSNANYNHSNVTGPAIVNNRPVAGKSVSDASNLNLNLQQSIFSWSNIQGLKSAKAGARASSGLADAERLNVALNVRLQFYALYKAIKLAEVRDEAVALSEEQLTRAETLFELGSVARNDVLQARVNLQQARLEQITARNQVEVERGRLAQLLALPVDTPLEIAPEIERPAVAPDSVTVLREALDARPDLLAAREGVSAADASVKSAWAGHLPELFGQLNWFWNYRPHEVAQLINDPNDPADDELVRLANDTNGWSVVAGVSLNIFDGFLVEGQVKSAKAELVRQKAQLAQAELAIALEIKEALLGVREATQSIAAAREGVSLADENLKLATERYQVGSGTILELNEAQVSLTEARSALVDAQAALRMAEAELDKARAADLP